MNRWTLVHQGANAVAAIIGLALLFPGEAVSQSKKGEQDTLDISVIPAPSDVNDLSMEVAALRTLYLMKVWPDQGLHRIAAWPAVEKHAADAPKNKEGKIAKCADPRVRKTANANKKYVKLLTDLRAAFVTGQEERINELSDQLESMSDDGDDVPELDDAIEITNLARFRAPSLVNGWFSTTNVNSYISAYGKDFPDPWWTLVKATRANGKGDKPSPETREFIAKEVGWQVAGLNVKRQKEVGAKVQELLDKADKMTNQEAKNGWSFQNPVLRKPTNEILAGTGPFELIRHVMEQDTAELLSNPRLKAAMIARKDYLKKVGYSLDRSALEIDKASGDD